MKADGFSQVVTHTDPPDFYYPDHSHPVDTTHVVLLGDMSVSFEGKARIVKEGERLDVSKHVVHSAKIGSGGCTFLTGVRV